jgi:hypothetical protein
MYTTYGTINPNIVEKRQHKFNDIFINNIEEADSFSFLDLSVHEVTD